MGAQGAIAGLLDLTQHPECRLGIKDWFRQDALQQKSHLQDR